MQRAVLGLGLKYIPRYPVTPVRLLPNYTDALFKYVRNIKWRVYYGDSSLNETPLYPRDSTADTSTLPYDCISAAQHNLNKYFGVVTDRLKTSLYAAPIIRLSKLDTLILDTFYALSKRTDIVIKPADKNLGTVVMFVHQYKHLCMSILNDTTTYAIATNYQPNSVYALLRQILHKHNRLFEPGNSTRTLTNKPRQLTKFAKSLLQLQHSPQLRVPAFYILPKMHKAVIAGRPIVSSINSVTYHTSVFLHKYLVRLRPYIPNICTNSASVILDMETLNTANPNLVIVTADVTSLYPSIPIQYGLIAVRVTLLRFVSVRSDIIEACDIDLVVELLNWVLRNNYLQYMGIIYKQLTGTAMGTPVAVMFADIVLSYLERPCLLYRPLYYRRYLDDIFCICTADTGDRIITTFNNRCSAIQLSAVTSSNTGVFLDMSITLVPGASHPVTTLYQKPTNRFCYITIHSSHHRSVPRNLVLSELRRYRLYCQSDADYASITGLFKARLIARGYPPSYLEPLFSTPLRRDELIQAIRERRNRLVDPALRDLIEEERKSVLVFTPCVLNRSLRIPWQSILEMHQCMLNDPELTRVYRSMRIVVGNSNPKAASYYLSRLRNLLPSTAPASSQL